MNKNLYFVISKEKDGKRVALAEKVSTSLNLVSYINSIRNVESVTAVDTWKKAKETATAWNQSYKENGTLDYSI